MKEKGLLFSTDMVRAILNGKTSSFCSGYVTWKMIERTQFVRLENNNTGSNFVPGENYHA